MKLAPKQIAQAGAATGNPLLWSGSKYTPSPNVAMALSGLDGSATVGATTIDAPTGISTIAAGATTCVVTNNLATAYCKVTLEWYGDHGATRSWVVRANGSFTVTLSSAAAANTSFGWTVSGMTSSMLNGLIHYWPLDGNSNDAYVTGNGTDTAVTYTTPKLGTACAAFNGSTSQIATLSTLKPLTFTVSGWLNPAYGSTTYGTMFHVGANSAGVCAYFSCMGANTWTLWNGSVAGCTGTIISGVWSHVAVTYDGTNSRLYVNGSLVSTVAIAIASASGPIYLGVQAGLATAYRLNGLVDSVVMHDRILTAGEITTLYNSGNGLETMTGTLLTGLIHQWSLNGNSNDTAASNGAAVDVTYAAGKLGQAASFNGTTSKIQTSADGPLGNAPRSFSFWVYGTDSSNSGYVSYGTNTATNLFCIGNASGTTLRVYNGSADIISIAGTFLNTWCHVVVTYDGTTTSAYLNGAAPVTSTATINTTHGNYLSFGYDATYSLFAGLMDDICMWDRTLTAGEVASLYNSGNGLETMSGSLLTGLIHQWHLNDNAVDSVAYSVADTDTAVTYGGKSGQCAMFNGTTSTITTPSLLKPSAWSMGCWIKPPPATSEAFGGGWLIGNPAAGQCAYWMRASATPTSWNLNNGSGASAIPHTIATDVWSHVVITYNGTQGAAYVNGALAAGPTALAIASSTGTIKIGHLTNITSVGHFNGLIDEPAMWNRVLSAAEVTNLYNAGAGRYYPSFA